MPDRGQVERLVEGADVGGALPQLDKHAIRLALVVERQRDADCDRQLAADDAPASQEVPLDVEQVHRAAVAAGHARRLAEQLGHDAVRLGPHGQGRAVVAIAREHVVARLERIDGADVGRLLADGEMAVAADARAGVLLLRALLEAADQQHLAQQALRRRRVDRD